jgi:hypothetical protein
MRLFDDEWCYISIDTFSMVYDCNKCLKLVNSRTQKQIHEHTINDNKINTLKQTSNIANRLLRSVNVYEFHNFAYFFYNTKLRQLSNTLSMMEKEPALP